MKTGLWIILLILACNACNNETLSNNEVGETEPADGSQPAFIEFQLNLHSGVSTRAGGIAGAVITDPRVLDSLVKDMRILVFDFTTGLCESYADFSPLRLSLSDTIRTMVRTGTKDFVFLTNVSDTAVMSTHLVGKTRDQILIKLKTQISGNGAFHDPAKQHFLGEVNNIKIVSNVPIIQGISLMRMVGQLETYAHFRQVWKMKSGDNTQKDHLLAPDYIRQFRSLVVGYIALNINLNKKINTVLLNPLTSDTAVIVQNTWDLTNHDTVARAIVLDFPTEQINVYPTLLLAAEVNPEHVDFVSTPGDLQVPGGNVIRYWWFQLKSHRIRENVRLILSLRSFLGTGAATPPGPNPDGTIDFNITISDWDPLVDEEKGDNGNFLPF